MPEPSSNHNNCCPEHDEHDEHDDPGACYDDNCGYASHQHKHYSSSYFGDLVAFYCAAHGTYDACIFDGIPPINRQRPRTTG